jgi:hypothetical protein
MEEISNILFSPGFFHEMITQFGPGRAFTTKLLFNEPADLEKIEVTLRFAKDDSNLIFDVDFQRKINSDVYDCSPADFFPAENHFILKTRYATCCVVSI